MAGRRARFHRCSTARCAVCVLALGWACLTAGVQAQQAVPPLTGRVVDNAHILSDRTEETLTAQLAAHEDSTGNQVAVLTVPSLQGESVESFSLRVAEAWKLGTASDDNGVLLVVARDDRKLRIEVGYGLEGALPDALARRIIDNEIVPHFREGDFDTGVLAGVQSILGAVEGTYTPSDDTWSGEKPPVWFGLVFLIIPSIFFLIAVFSPGAVRWFLFFFLIPFYGAGGFVLTGTLAGTLVVLGLYAAVFIGASLHPKVRAVQKKLREAQKTGKSVKVGPFTVSSSGSSGSGWSSGGGGFSGGGGSFGGGGASGGW